MSKASIAIFKKEVQYPDTSSSLVSDEFFEAIQEVIRVKGLKILKTKDSFYIIKYRETGPFAEKFNDDWLPVYVARIERWSSGGVTKTEFKEWESQLANGRAEKPTSAN